MTLANKWDAPVEPDLSVYAKMEIARGSDLDTEDGRRKWYALIVVCDWFHRLGYHVPDNWGTSSIAEILKACTDQMVHKTRWQTREAWEEYLAHKGFQSFPGILRPGTNNSDVNCIIPLNAAPESLRPVTFTKDEIEDAAAVKAMQFHVKHDKVM